MDKVICRILIVFFIGFICFNLGRLIEINGSNYPVQANGFCYPEILEVEITAYSPSPHITQGDPFQMASGKIANPKDLEQLKYVAVSRDLMEEYGIEYGDKIYIEFEVQDKMGPKVKNGVDIFMRNLDLARKFGRQKRRIIIKEKE